MASSTSSRVLRGHGIRLEDIRFEPGAWERAQALARELGIEEPLARLPNAPPSTRSPLPPAEPARPPRDLTEALSHGTKLGSPATWNIQTSGATISFAVRAGETVYPAVIFDAPKWTDPAPRDLVAEERAAVRELRELPALVQLIRSLVTKHRALELSRYRRVRLDAEVTELWHKSDPSRKYPEPMARFRRDIPNEDGSFSPNPDWIDAGADDEDEITLDALGRRLSLTFTYVTFDARGDRQEVKQTVRLEPTKDAWVKLADEPMQLNERGGGKLIEHWYNPKTAQYQSVTVEVSERAGFRRVELSRQAPVPVTAVRVRQETVYDSVIDIHDFITKNMGLPFTCDTSSGLAVWNYPVDQVRIDRVRELEKAEDAKRWSYTTYRLRLRTMGGPSVDASYIIKRDEQGNAVRAVAIDPMPDFAYRNEHWVCAPAAPDLNGTLAYNTHALEAGFLTDKARERIVPEVWRRLGALVYASLSGPGEGPVYLFEQEDGTLILFEDAASFEAAMQADQAPRPSGARVS